MIKFYSKIEENNVTQIFNFRFYGEKNIASIFQNKTFYIKIYFETEKILIKYFCLIFILLKLKVY